MKVSERCPCGATLETKGGLKQVFSFAKHWRREHLCPSRGAAEGVSCYSAERLDGYEPRIGFVPQPQQQQQQQQQQQATRRNSEV